MPQCLKCQQHFPNRKKIDGRAHVLSTRKYCLDCSPFKKHNTARIHEVKSCRVCPRCKTEKPLGEFYKRRSGKSPSVYCILCSKEQAVERQKLHKAKAIEYKGGRCIDCGYNRCVAALEFHHLDPKEKDPCVDFRTSSFEKIKVELDKCILLCCRCHRERHHLVTPAGFEPAAPRLEGECSIRTELRSQPTTG